MWKYNSELNLEMNINKNIIDNVKKYSKISGILFIILGLVGIIFPMFMSLTTVAFVSYLMLFAGLFAGWFTWTTDKKDWTGWLKSFILILVSLYMILYPLQGVAAVGLLFAIYFFVDAFSSFGIAFSLKGQKHWILWLFNAITSLIIAVIFTVGWPFSSLYLIGILVGISLLFDGIALLSGSMLLNKVEKSK
jgi:uncharacterized membrane protein HdeD (DUF308 family)